MPFEILTIPCLSDNYAYLLHDPASNRTALVDAPEAAPVLAALADRGWGLDTILLTHHHWDHIDATAELVEKTGAKVVGAAADTHRLPPLDQQVAEGTDFDLFGETVQVFDVSGHTIGHIAFYMPGSKAVFTADSLMALGCGRLFEGQPAQMWESLSKLAALPADTLVYSGHEYTQSNAAFALSVDPNNVALQTRAAAIAAARAENLPTVPSPLQLERETNPFLRASDADMKAQLGMEGAPDAEVFAEIRHRKDTF